MTVAELIAELKKQDPKAEVIVPAWEAIEHVRATVVNRASGRIFQGSRYVKLTVSEASVLKENFLIIA